MRKFINQIRAAWHHGKGSKYTRKGNFGLALYHFQTALKFATNSDNQASVALEVECIARTFMRLGDYVKAKENAEECLSLYNKQGSGPAFAEGITRVTELLKIIDQKAK
jgi:tetratricopeptide (TPR) repeat protein